MAMQEIGGGGSKTDVLLSFLNLPNGHAFKKHTFHRIEDKLGDTIEKVTQQSMKDALAEEIRLQLIEDDREGDLKKWQAGEKINRVFCLARFYEEWNQGGITSCLKKPTHATWDCFFLRKKLTRQRFFPALTLFSSIFESDLLFI